MVNETRRVLAVIPDLFFLAKVTATAKAARIPIATATPEAAAGEAQRSHPAIVLVDLHLAGMPALVAALKSAAPDAQVIGFYSHVATAIRDAAVAAGIDAALPRSQFVAKLPGLLERGVAGPA